MAFPVAGAVPLATPVGAAPSPDLVFATNPDLTISPPMALQRGKRRRWRPVFVGLVALAGTAGLMYGIYSLISLFVVGSKVNDLLEKYNCALTPPSSWKQDRTLQDDMAVTYALRRKDPPAQFALDIDDFEDFSKRYPTKALLLEVFKDRAGRLFKSDFAWQPKAPATVDNLDKKGTLAKQPAYVLEFEGQRDSVTYKGECHIAEHRGYVYWVFTFAPETSSADEQEAMTKSWNDIRTSLTLLDQRDGWKAQPRKTKTYAGKGYELNCPLDIWDRSKADNPDPMSDLMLLGVDPRAEKEGEDSKAGKSANLNVVLLGKADEKDPGKLLRDHYLARQVEAEIGKLDQLELKLLEGRDGKPLVSERDFGKAKGFVSKNQLTVTGGNTADRFVVLVAIPRADSTIGIILDSRLKLRDFWEQEFAAVLEGFKLAK